MRWFRSARAGYTTNSVAIATESLTKRYGRTIAVDHLDFCVERNEVFGFLGPNGAGKTTTMRMLLGLVRPTSGSIRILGMDIGTDLPAILARTGVIVETSTFYPFLSGWDNLRVLARVIGTPDARVSTVLDLVDLTSDAKRQFKTYSLGMKQRLAVGAALLTDPDLVILDEPANGLDPAGIVDMRALMKRLKDEGHSVLISSHVLHEVEQVCDHIMILVKGRVAVHGRVSDLLNHNRHIEIGLSAEAEAVLRQVPWVTGVTRDGDRLSSLAQLILAGMFSRLGGVWAILAAHFPFPYAQALITRVSASAFSPGEGPATIDLGTPQIGESLLFLTIYVAILLTITFVAVCTRDIST